MDNYVEVYGRVNENFKNIAKKVAFNVLELMNEPTGLEVAIQFVSEKEIQSLNLSLRNIDRVTDVLSFPSTNIVVGEKLNLDNPEYISLKNENGQIHLGDIALCTKRLREQAKTFGNSPEQELKKLVIHSMLHLLGYDHIKDEDYVIMNEKEIELDKEINL